MEFRTPTVSPLRQRMLDDMRMRKLQPRTQAGYIRAVRRFTIFVDRDGRSTRVDQVQLKAAQIVSSRGVGRSL